jgi:hypothetical protein
MNYKWLNVKNVFFNKLCHLSFGFNLNLIHLWFITSCEL